MPTASVHRSIPVDVGTTAGPAARQLLSREERQAQILRAAATAFAHGGFAATSMDDVAAEAGVTKLILYRHFESKEELYRSVLSAVAARLRDEFLKGLNQPEPVRRGFTTRSILVVARENPDGFRLLTTHAAREPQFAELAREFKDQGLVVADTMIGDMIPDPVVKAWASGVIADYVVQGVLVWLDAGDPSRDDEFVELASRGLRGMFLSWADHDRLPDHVRAELRERHDR
jgi:AcrR family transcriptional regulator